MGIGWSLLRMKKLVSVRGAEYLGRNLKGRSGEGDCKCVVLLNIGGEINHMC